MARDLDLRREGATLVDLEQAAQDRLADAEALITAGRGPTAVAMLVYALEIQLKVQVCKRLDLEKLPIALELHELESLLVLTGLKSRLSDPGNVSVKQNWDAIVGKYSTRLLSELRYGPNTSMNPEDAVTLRGRLVDPPDGVLPWLRAQP